LEITTDVMDGHCEWKELFEEVNFFSRYKHFLVVVCAAESEEHHLVWEGMVKSKLRHLIGSLERNPRITLGHINPKTYKPNTNPYPFQIGYENPIAEMWFVGLEFNKSMMGTKNVVLTEEITGFHDTVNRATRYSKGRETFTDDMKMLLNYVARKDLIKWISKSELTKGRPARKPTVVPTAGSTPSTPRIVERRESQSVSGVDSSTPFTAGEVSSTSDAGPSNGGEKREENGEMEGGERGEREESNREVMDATCSSSSVSSEAVVTSSAAETQPTSGLAVTVKLCHSASMPNLGASATSDRQPAQQLPLSSPDEANAANPIPTETVKNDLLAGLDSRLLNRKRSAEGIIDETESTAHKTRRMEAV
ncbi:hypothetical protein PENTCL1PPCAC_2568, partial [Pristionchus entomophagus]